MDEIVLFDVQDGVAVITFNRPERLNAWIPELQSRYFDLLEQCAERGDVRAIVLTGAGRGFCAGADMQALEQLAGGNGEGEAVRPDSRPVTFALGIPKPVIAAINGPCAGLGLVHALMCDLRFGRDGAKNTPACTSLWLLAGPGAQ